MICVFHKSWVFLGGGCDRVGCKGLICRSYTDKEGQRLGFLTNVGLIWMSVNVKDYTVFCVPSKVHCWYCWLFCALCQSRAVYWTITYLMYATGSHDNTTWDEVILSSETVRRWYTLYVVFGESGVHKQPPLVTYGAALCISGLSLVCRHTSQCSIYIFYQSSSFIFINTYIL